MELVYDICENMRRSSASYRNALFSDLVKLDCVPSAAIQNGVISLLYKACTAKNNKKK